jgi:hypothetical protein
MKSLNSFWQRSKLLMPFAFIFLGALSCSKESTSPQPPTPQEQTKMLLTDGTWKLQSESANGVDQTDLYKDLTISFTSSGFTTTSSDVIWPHHGTWSFDGTTTNIRRNDGLVIQIDVSSTTLVMTLVWTQTTIGSGKINSTSGQNVFTMVKL